MQWKFLTSTEDVKALQERSLERHCLIFKHSTRCPVSSIVQSRLESDLQVSAEHLEVYFLDLLRHRAVSDAVASVFGVYHESPQILLIHEGECILDASHLDVSVPEILDESGLVTTSES